MDNNFRIILDSYFDDVEQGYGWVEYDKVLTDMQLGYNVDLTKEDLDEYLSRADLIEVVEHEGSKILIVNENLDFEIDILSELQ